MSAELENIDVRDFLEKLEIRNVTKATEHEYCFSCPYPNHVSGDTHPSCYMNIHTTAFFCHACKERGNAINFASYVLAISPLEATRLLRERYFPGGINPDEREVVKEIKAILNPVVNVIEQPKLTQTIVDYHLVDWHQVANMYDRAPGALRYFLDRGFTPETLTDWEFGYDIVSDRPIFTVRDLDGTPIGFKARAWGEHQHPKYLVLGDKPGRPDRHGFPCYFPSHVVFGAHRIEQGQPVVVCEGELNAIAITERTEHQAVAINGSHFSSRHAEIITALTDRAIIFLDTDNAGTSATWGWDDSKGVHHSGIVETLALFIDVDVCPAHDGDPASMMSDEINDCINSARNWLPISIGL